jgi:hypothetical protein
MLLREEPSETDQGLTDVACYPSEDSLIKMLCRAGFGFVYRLAPLPKHDDFRETFEHRRKRIVLLGSAIPIALLGFRLCIETYEKQDPGTKVSAFPGRIPQRISQFLALPAAKKYLSLALSCPQNPSRNSDPLAITLRGLVACPRRRAGSQAGGGKFRTGRTTFCRTASASWNDRPGHRGTPRLVHLVVFEMRRRPGPSDCLRGFTSRMPPACQARARQWVLQRTY